MAERSGGSRGRRKKFLTVEQKYELWTAMVRGDATQRQLADRWGVDRTTVAKVAQVAKHGALSALEASKPGRPGTVDPREQQLRQARGDRPVDRSGQRAGHRAGPVAGETARGLVGPIPARVSADDKHAVLELIDDAVAAGFTFKRACVVLDIGGGRVRRWRRRRRSGADLADGRPGGNPVHGLLDWEVAEILAVYDEFGDVDGSHRKLAHRGSYERRVWVSESSVFRVLTVHGKVLPQRPRPAPTAKRPWPAWVELRPRQVWGYDVTHFGRCGRAVIAIIDLVSRKWIDHLVTVEETSTEVAAVFTRALDREGLLIPGLAITADGTVPITSDDTRRPILLAVSDNGPR